MSDESLLNLVDAVTEAATVMRGLESVAASMERTTDDAAWSVVRQTSVTCADKLAASAAATCAKS